MIRAAALALLLSIFGTMSAAEPNSIEFFEKKVRPVLAEQCFSCHSATATKLKSGLRLDSRAAMLSGGERGPALVPGSAEKSRLIQVITYQDPDLHMPPRAKLHDAVIADLTAWVKAGAPWPGGEAVAVEKKTGFDVMKRKAEHWCWQPVRATPPPAVHDTAWPLTPADRFILAKLEAAGLRPAAPVTPTAWLRRVYFDLIGLPPTPEEVAAFERDESATPQAAMARVIDRLLASPHFGERWARHWLDLVRYAETRGHEFDPIIPNAYQYRDYVIRAFNADVPYNQFVTEHIAGDLMKSPRLDPRDGFNESILGTGFWFLGEEVHSPVDIRADECDRNDNKIDVFSKTFLALTVSCARCHDHKFDAISQKDYYALTGYLLSSSYRQVRFDTNHVHDRINSRRLEVEAQHRSAIVEALSAAIKPGVASLKGHLLAAREAMRSGKPGESDVVRAWAKYLDAAAKDPANPFHVWASTARLDGAEFTKRISSLNSTKTDTRPDIDDESEDENQASNWIASSVVGIKPNPYLWKSDGPCYNPIGGIDWGTDPARPILRIREDGYFALDPFWGRLTTPAGTENDHGALGAVPRSGRTLRSTNFTLQHGKIFVRAKGKGRIYAAIDSHTLIAGPLHGRLIRDFDTGNKWQWVEYDLTPYIGHRMHLEVWPIDDREFAIGSAKQSPKAPKEWNNLVLPWMQWLDPKPAPTTPDELAAIYQRWFELLVHNLYHDEADHPNTIAIANLPLEHPELFAIKDFANIIATARPLITALNKLAAEVRRDSRLAPAMGEGTRMDDYLHIRGSHKARGEEVQRRFLSALVGDLPPGRASSFHVWQGSGRDTLAQQMTDPAVTPLIARVIVNRVWHHLFGRGIVASVDNFGVMGDRPTHPELLDFLADRFVRQGWSIKTLIRELVLSQTYRQASAPSQAADAENKLFHRANLRRLQGEAIRDAMLSVAGRLDSQLYGKPVPVHLTEFLDGRGRPGASGPLDGAGRRSLYTAVRRNFLPSFMLAFDTPSPFSTMGRRTVSNVPAQALILMNDPFVHQQADRWGQRMAQMPGDVETRIRQMYVSVFTRFPSADELAKSRAFIESRGADPKTWGELAHVLFNVKEFIYLP